VTAADYFQENPINQVVIPSASSWGYQGYYEIWLVGKNHWLYPPLFKAIERLDDFLDNNPDPNADVKLALDQYIRELILAQNSDLAYILHTGTFSAYAENRLRQHIDHIDTLYRQISENKVDAGWLAKIRHDFDIFNQYQLVDLYLDSRARYRAIPG
jgi:1,4-alpha-glucan branching enzyme